MEPSDGDKTLPERNGSKLHHSKVENTPKKDEQEKLVKITDESDAEQIDKFVEDLSKDMPSDELKIYVSQFGSTLAAYKAAYHLQQYQMLMEKSKNLKSRTLSEDYKDTRLDAQLAIIDQRSKEYFENTMEEIKNVFKMTVSKSKASAPRNQVTYIKYVETKRDGPVKIEDGGEKLPLVMTEKSKRNGYLDTLLNNFQDGKLEYFVNNRVIIGSPEIPVWNALDHNSEKPKILETCYDESHVGFDSAPFALPLKKECVLAWACRVEGCNFFALNRGSRDYHEKYKEAFYARVEKAKKSARNIQREKKTTNCEEEQGKENDKDLEIETIDLEKIDNLPEPKNELSKTAPEKLYHTLKNRTWLNDVVINDFMEILISQENIKSDAKYTAASTFYFDIVENQEILDTSTKESWGDVLLGHSEKAKFLDSEKVYIPIHLKDHWSLVIYDVQNRILTYFDSMKNKSTNTLNLISKAIQAFEEHKEIEPQKIKKSIRKGLPQQKNKYDCGVFMLMFVERDIRRKEMNFNQQNIPAFRVKMFDDLVKGTISESY